MEDRAPRITAGATENGRLQFLVAAALLDSSSSSALIMSSAASNISRTSGILLEEEEDCNAVLLARRRKRAGGVFSLGVACWNIQELLLPVPGIISDVASVMFLCPDKNREGDDPWPVQVDDAVSVAAEVALQLAMVVM